MAGADKHELEFFLLRYVPDAVKDEFVNVGVVLVGEGADAGFAEVRFTRDWRRVWCLDPGADVGWLQALERDIRMRLKDAAGRADILDRLQDLCSNGIQISAAKGCLGEEPAEELESLAKMYLGGGGSGQGAGVFGGGCFGGGRRRGRGNGRPAGGRGLWRRCAGRLSERAC